MTLITFDQQLVALDVGAVKKFLPKLTWKARADRKGKHTPRYYGALVKAGADLEAKDKSGLTALQVSLLAGWQNIAELLIKSGASTAGVASIKSRLTCPDCKRIVAQYNL